MSKLTLTFDDKRSKLNPSCEQVKLNLLFNCTLDNVSLKLNSILCLTFDKEKVWLRNKVNWMEN